MSHKDASRMTDSKYFTTTKKGEIFELKSELNSDKKEKKREAVKKVHSLHVKNMLWHLYNLLMIWNFDMSCTSSVPKKKADFCRM